jgi:hypothetical protein
LRESANILACEENKVRKEEEVKGDGKIFMTTEIKR